jgi:hypothetical protein
VNTVSLIIYPASDVRKTTKFFATILGGEPTPRATTTPASRPERWKSESFHRRCIALRERSHL